MADYIFFSKSNWSEPPRLRHQLARLLQSHGEKVLFFQNPAYVWQKVSDRNCQVKDGIRVLRTRQLIHHQFRVTGAVRVLNAMLEKMSIRRACGPSVRDAILVNFNYDYFFLREVFPTNKIVTIINDDFVGQAKFLSGRHVEDALRMTCATSNLVFAVSYPLIEQLSAWCRPRLLLPWSDTEYRRPVTSGSRDSVLLWGHITDRVDFELIRELAVQRPEYRFYLVGPVAKDSVAHVHKLVSVFDNVSALPATDLDDLPLHRFFAAVIPYKSGVRDIEAITLANKTLQLMARGLPLVTHGMPHFLENPAIFKANDAVQFIGQLDACRVAFDDLQSEIKRLVCDNQSEPRYELFIQSVNEL